jgi:hypothetical protein
MGDVSRIFIYDDEDIGDEKKMSEYSFSNKNEMVKRDK